MKILYAVIINLSFLIFAGGCYTMLQHPKVDANHGDGTPYTAEVNFYDDCASCHNSENANYHAYSPQVNAVSTYHYDDGYYRPAYYGDYNGYYNTPWWHGYSAPAEVVKYRDQENSGGGTASSTLRNNDSGRSSEGRRDRNNDNYHDYNRPTVTGNSGSSGSSNTSTSSNNNSGSRSSSSSSSNNERSETPKTRNNDSERSNGGRR